MLESFGYDEFRNASGLFDDLKSKMSTYRAWLHSTEESFWTRVEGAKEYDDKIVDGRTWRDDHIETSPRVWEWWRTHFRKLPYFSTATRLVALAPISSAAVERIFSQAKFIIETVGENILQEFLEVRLMERINVYS